MSYGYATLVVLLASIGSALVTYLIQRSVPVESRRRHHDVGAVVFLQLGVVFAVLLAFVIDETWDEYNQAAQAIVLEVGALHEAATIASTLPDGQGRPILQIEAAYLRSVVAQEWPAMARGRGEDAQTDRRLEALIERAAALPVAVDGEGDRKRAILSLLEAAHTHRQARIFEAGSGVPILLWIVLVLFTGVLSVFVSFASTAHKRVSVAIAACFTFCIAIILVSGRLLDYPFEGALALQPTAFLHTAAKIANLQQAG